MQKMRRALVTHQYRPEVIKREVRWQLYVITEEGNKELLLEKSLKSQTDHECFDKESIKRVKISN